MTWFVLKKNKYKQKLTSQILDKSIPPGKWWRIVKSLSKCNNKKKVPSPINSNGKIHIHPVDKASELNKHFASISHIETTNEPRLPPQGPGPPHSIERINITAQDVVDQLSNLNITKPPGPDGISPKILKNIIPSIKHPIAKLFNLTLQHQELPFI